MLLASTDAAADAHRWLGDRALSTGQSAEAIGHYRRALRGVSPSGEAALRGRIRLAAAMQGRMAESPVTEPIVVGKMNLDAERFEQWVHDLYETHRRRRSDAGNSTGSTPTDHGFCPPPAQYHGQPGSIFEGTAATTLPGAGPSPADRMARQLAVAVSGGRMFVSDRRNVTAYELNRGKTLWSHHAGISSKAPPWPLVAMQPLVTGRYVTTRLLGTKGPELACFRAADGKLAWQVVIDGCVASDPTGDDQRIFAFLATSDRAKELTLSLGTFDPHRGQLLGQAAVARFHDHWEGQLSCRAVAVDDCFVATAGGAVFCCDRRGRVLWIRRQAWQTAKPRAATPSGEEEFHGSPLVSEGRVYATQPGVAEIECLDLETGRRYWNLPTPRPMTIVGRVGDLLITAGTQQVVAVDRTNGKIAWSHVVKGSLHAALCGRPGEIVYLATLDGIATAEAKRAAVLTWLDPKTGSPRKQVAPGLPSGQDGLSGPLVVSGSRWWGLAATRRAPARWTIVELTEAE
ncbi:MAG: PQQ-binding-like beta-propeller repeat protein [Planctomycetes bacterium]|nr:PQQ-binding-like beta-propeller repeat protein [Planctomycetota bacterium]